MRTIMILTVLALPTAVLRGDEFNKTVDIGQKAPDFSGIPAIYKGKDTALSLSDIEEDVVVLTFLANHSPHVVAIEDHLNDLVENYKGKSVKLVGVNVNDIEEDKLPAIKEWVEKNNSQYVYGYDETQEIAHKYGATKTPQFVVLDQDRVIRYMGGMYQNPLRVQPEDTNYIQEAVDAILSGEEIEVKETEAVGDSIRGLRDAVPVSLPVSREVHAKAVRYTDVECPEEVWIEDPRFSIVLTLRTKSPADSRVVEPLEVREDLPVRARLEPNPLFEVLDPEEPTQAIDIVPNEDSRPVVFFLKPKEVGSTSLIIDLSQGTEPLATLTFPIEVTADEGHYPSVTQLEPLPIGKKVEPPFRTLVIERQLGTQTLGFVLLGGGEGGAGYERFQDMDIDEDDLEAYTARLYETIANLVRAQDDGIEQLLEELAVMNPPPDQKVIEAIKKQSWIPRRQIDRKLKTLGYKLWDELVPADFKELYEEHRDTWSGRSLLVYSDEPNIPWELVWPYGSGWEDPGPWCQTMRMTRWLRKDENRIGNRHTPAPQLSLGAIAVLAPQYTTLPNLAGAKVEKASLAQMIAGQQLRDVSPARPTWADVMDLLEGGDYDWVHAAAHGNFFEGEPGSDSLLWLEKGSPLTPDDLRGPRILDHFSDVRPAFFLNACQLGRQGWAVTRIDGWANRLIGNGAGLFVAPLWEVKDRSALRFSQVFYEALLGGSTVGEAVHDAREEAWAAGDPTWAAYSVYAHPNARLKVKQYIP